MKTIYVDMDGVLVAFYEFCSLYINMYEDHDPRNKGQLYKFMDWAESEFRMFSMMPPKKDLDLAMQFLIDKQTKGWNIEILSSSGTSKMAPSISRSKNIWIDTYIRAKYPEFQDMQANFVEGSAKKVEFYKEGDVLIDDYFKPGQMWEKAGGLWIHHTSWVDTILIFNGKKDETEGC